MVLEQLRHLPVIVSVVLPPVRLVQPLVVQLVLSVVVSWVVAQVESPVLAWEPWLVVHLVAPVEHYSVQLVEAS